MTDLLDLLAEMDLAETPWTGAPLAYTTDYWTPDEFVAAFDRYIAERGRMGCSPQSHMWSAFLVNATVAVESHICVSLSADTRYADTRCPCPLEHDHSDLPDKLMYQTNCPDCRWHAISSNENTAVEAWHDHALPGWRDLPVMPIELVRRDTKDRLEKPAQKWLEEHQPSEWRFPGAPIRTGRKPLGTRHVAGRSPHGGYDLGHATAPP